MSSETSNNVPALPRGWESPSLAEIAQINPQLDRCVISDSVEVNFVPMRAVDAEGGGLASPEVRVYGQVKKGYTSFLSGDVIMAKITPCMENGKTTVVPDLPGSVCFGSTEFHVVRPESGVAPRWIARFLLQHEVRRTAQRAMTGGVGQMRVPAYFLEAIRIPLPPSDEQNRIADVLDELLSDLDAGVTALQRVRTKLARYRAAVIRAAVEGTLTAEWRHQHPDAKPASELIKRILTERRRQWEQDQLRRFKEKFLEPPNNWKAKYKEPIGPNITTLPPLPVGWCWVSLDQLFRVERGRFSVRPRNDPRYYCGANPFVQIGDLPREGGTIRSYVQTLNAAGLAVSKKFPSGTVLIAIVGATIGNTGILSFDGCCPDSLVALQSSSSLLLRFGELFLRSKKLSLRVAASASGGQPNINLELLQPLSLPLPSKDEVEAIVEAVEDQLSVIEHLESDLDGKLRDAQALRQTILRDAFRGRLVPQDPIDVTASELLKCITVEREQRAREAIRKKLANENSKGPSTGRRVRPKKKPTKEN